MELSNSPKITSLLEHGSNSHPEDVTYIETKRAPKENNIIIYYLHEGNIRISTYKL